MKKVITYGTYDLLHEGHIRLLKRVKALGDYLVVGVTANDFDLRRGKINVTQSLTERIEAVKNLNIADEIIVEEYEGQKIDDILRLGIDVFTVGSDWVGKFDYLKEYCEVVYLPRTEGISSSSIRGEDQKLRLGLVGDSPFVWKIARECPYINGIELKAICISDVRRLPENLAGTELVTSDLDELLNCVDAVYIHSTPKQHYDQIIRVLNKEKHILCESPLTLDENQTRELYNLANEKNCILQEGLKTAYALAFSRLLLLIKAGKIGEVVSVDSACSQIDSKADNIGWSCINAWGPTALLPIFKILGTKYKKKYIVASFDSNNENVFTKIDFSFNNSVASMKIGKKVKTEGELIISGSKGYVYVPAPWWKTDYFEIRYENPQQNEKYFYQLEGEGIRYELIDFLHRVYNKTPLRYIDPEVSEAISSVMEDFNKKIDFEEIHVNY